MSPALQKTPVISKVLESATGRNHPVAVPAISSLSKRPTAYKKRSRTHLGVVSSPDSSFAPDTDWPTAMGTGFPATTAKEKRRNLIFSPPRAFRDFPSLTQLPTGCRPRAHPAHKASSQGNLRCSHKPHAPATALREMGSIK